MKATNQGESSNLYSSFERDWYRGQRAAIANWQKNYWATYFETQERKICDDDDDDDDDAVIVTSNDKVILSL